MCVLNKITQKNIKRKLESLSSYRSILTPNLKNKNYVTRLKKEVIMQARYTLHIAYCTNCAMSNYATSNNNTIKHENIKIYKNVQI